MQMLLIDFPLFMASTMSVSTFYLVSQKELYPKSWYKSFIYMPFVMALGGVGLTITNTKAVMEALFGVKSAFARTPKYRVKKKGEKIAGEGVSQAAGHCAVDRAGDRMLLCVDGLVCDHDGELLYGAVSGAVRVWILVHGLAESAAGHGLNGAGILDSGCMRSRIRWASSDCVRTSDYL